jgi:hypothetical protein
MVHCTNVDRPTETNTLPEQVRTQIFSGIQSWSDQEVTKEDLLRLYRDQIALLFVTEQVRSALAMDPFEHLRENISADVLEQLQNSLTVTNHHSVHTLEGYVRREATVCFSPLPLRSRRRNRTTTEAGLVELHFQYTRPTVPPLRISYTIALSATEDATAGPPRPLLWVYVDAAGSVPSHRPAVCSNEDADGWSDMDEDKDESGGENDPDGAPDFMCDSKGEEIKRPVESAAPLGNPWTDADDDDDDGKADQYAAGMDPEVVSQFTQAVQLGSSIPDITVFFLLMTFPFYEHEWDIVGYLLKEVFDSDDDGEEEDDS